MNDPAFYEHINRAVLGPQFGPVILTPAPTNVTDIRTGKPHYPPGTLARALQKQSEAAEKI